MLRTVKHGGNKAFGWCLSALVGASAFALTSLGATRNPYSAIVERNVFGLRPPPPPIDVNAQINRPPPPKILLTGITTILGKKVAFLTMPSSKPGSPPDSEMLAEGQALDEVEVKIIDEKAGIVVVENHGVRQTLDFDQNGSKPSGPPPGMISGMPSPMSMPPPSAPAPNVLPVAQAGNVIRPLRSLPTRNNVGGNNNFGGYNNGIVSPNGTGQNQAQLSPEEQVALIELQRAKAIQEGDPISKLYPPTVLTRDITGEASPGGPPGLP